MCDFLNFLFALFLLDRLLSCFIVNIAVKDSRALLLVMPMFTVILPSG